MTGDYRRDAGPENWDRYQDLLGPAIQRVDAGDVEGAAHAFARIANVRADDEPITDTLGHLLSLVRYLRNTERVAAAEISAREALALAEAMHPSPHRDLIYAKARLEQILVRQSKYVDAVDVKRTIIADLESLYGARSQNVAAILLDLAKLHYFADQRETAEATIRRSIDILEHYSGVNLELLAQAHMDLTRMIALTNVADAVVHAQRALVVLREAGLSDEDCRVKLNLRYLEKYMKW
jgi:hypothetical protein